MPKFRLSCALAALSLLSAAPVAAEVTGGGPDSFVSRHEVVVKASPKEVWLALISPATWWTSEHTWSGEAANLTLTPQAGDPSGAGGPVVTVRDVGDGHGGEGADPLRPARNAPGRVADAVGRGEIVLRRRAHQGVS